MSYVMLTILATLMVIDYRQTVVGIWAYKMTETQVVPKSLIERFGARGLASYQFAWFGLVCGVVFVFPSQWGAPLMPIVAISSAIIQNAHCLRERRKSWGRYSYWFAARIAR